MLRIEHRAVLGDDVLADILGLIDAVTDAEGHRPVGEHKYSHLREGARDWVGVLAYNGEHRLVGYAHTRWNPHGERPRVAVEVVVHPAVNRAGGSEVVQQLMREVRALVARAGGGLLWWWMHRVEDATQTQAAHLGFRVQRELAFLQRWLDTRPEAPPAPEDVQIRTYQASDEAAFLEVNNAAFAGHPENGAWDGAEFARRRAFGWFDPEGLFLAWRGEELLGFHWTKWHGHESDEAPPHSPVGEVYVLAVHPRAQGLGLGRILLDVGLAHLFDRGCRQAILYVDCANESAVNLYQRNGFRLCSREVCYEQAVPSAPAHDLTRPSG